MSTLTLPPVTARGAGRPRVLSDPGGRHARVRQPVRLTARGRLALRAVTALAVLIAVTSMILLGVLLGSGRAEGGQSHTSVPVSYHVVAPGETLWAIALEAEPGRDPRDLIERIVELNQLSTANVPVGTRLAVPVREVTPAVRGVTG